jgi:RNA polymerase primary sigma factor
MSDHLQDSDIHKQEISSIMDAIRKDPQGQSLITAEEEISLVNRLKANPNDLVARDRFMLANAGLVALVARKYRGSSINATVGDLIQEGNIGMMLKAIPRYNPFHEGKRIRFSTHAVYWIAQRIRIYIQDNRNVFRLKQGAEHYQKLRQVSGAFQLANWREPSVEELARALGWTEEAVIRVTGYGQTPMSLDEPYRASEQEGRTFGDTFEDEVTPQPSDCMEATEDHDIFYAALNRLDDRPVLIVALRNGLMGAEKKTLREVGKRLSISSERVRQCEEEALLEIQKSVTFRKTFLRTQSTEARQGKSRCASLLAKADIGSGLVASLGVAPWKVEEEEGD